jgi:uncharacterized peroxidase-related enzyme
MTFIQTAFIQTTLPADADGDVRAMYERQQAKLGYLPNYALPFCHRPALMASWAGLLADIRRHVEPRRFELVTLSAAHALRNSYCSLAHAKAMTELDSVATVRALVETPTDDAGATLHPADATIAAYARKVAQDAASITETDIAALREHGLTDTEIFDIAATAAARAFFAKLLDALGVRADTTFGDMEASLRAALVVGRPIAD